MRRGFLRRLLGLPALALAPDASAAPAPAAATTAAKSKVLIKSAWDSADPTQASFPFHHAKAFAEAGHEVQIFLLGEAVTLMRAAVALSVVPVGWPPLAEGLAKVVEHKVPIHV
jgi:predicted peroxiredoxin